MKRFLCLLLLCFPLAALAESDDDKGRLSRFLEDSLSGAGRTVTIDGFTGALSSVASVEKITIADAKGIWLSLEAVALDWNRAALLKGHLEVNSLTAKSIKVTRRPQSEPDPLTPEATPFALPDLPVSVEIGSIKAEKIAIHKDVLGSALTAKLSGQLSLAAGAGKIGLALNRTDEVAGAFLLNAAFENTNRHLKIDLSATEAQDGLVASLLSIPDRPSIALTLSGDAPLSEFEANLALATDGTERIVGSIKTVFQQKTETVSAEQSHILDISGDLSPLFKARFRPFFGTQSSLRAKLRNAGDGRIHLDDLALETAALRASGRAVIAPTNLPESFSLSIAMGPTDGETLLLPASLELSLGSASLRAHYDASQSDTWTLDGVITRFSHPDIFAERIALNGSGRIQAESPRALDGALQLSATGLRASQPNKTEVARALGPEAKAELGWTWQEGGAVDISRLLVTTLSGNLDATASIAGSLTAPEITTHTTMRLSDLAVLEPIAGQPLRGTLKTTMEGVIHPLSGAFHLDLEAISDKLRTGTQEIDALTQDGLSTLSAQVSRDETGLAWDNLTLTTPALETTSTGRLASDGGRIALKASLDSLARLLPSISGPVTLSTEAEGQANLWTLNLTADGPGGAQIATQGTISSDLKQADLNAKGMVSLALLNGFTNAARIDGPARFDLALRGPLSVSSLNGSVDITDAKLSVADPQTTLENINAAARISNGAANVSSNGRLALGGAFSANGRVDLTTPYGSDINIRFDKARIRYERLLETLLNGEIRITGPLTGGALIGGEITLDTTEVRVDSVGTTSAPLPDITHLNAPAKVNQTRLFAGTLETGTKKSGPAYLLDLGISAPSRIFLRGRGLDAEFGGALRLRGDTTNIVTSGGFDLVRGRMSFLTKRFDLSEGRISLQGGPIPYIRLVATTQSTDARFDVTLEGTADAPNFSIASDPEMPQDEALARILFGETLSDISPLQAARLAAAVATLTGSGSGFNPLGSLREGAGVDDLDLKSDEEGNTSLTAGKYISDNIYTEIEIDNTGKSAISLNLDISPNLTITGQADSEANSGLGLFFQKDY